MYVHSSYTLVSLCVCSHNLGMQHSNENGGEYGDQSGYMGFRCVHSVEASLPFPATMHIGILHSELFSSSLSSYPQRDGPLMCFNAFKHYKFDWYSSQTETITGDYTGELVAFTDAGQAPGRNVIFKLDDVYMQFNRATGMNSGTREKVNEVVLVQGTQASRQSEVLAGLGSGESYSTGGFTIEVCSINYGAVDYAYVSIFANGGNSGCSTRGVGSSPTCQDDISANFFVYGFVQNCQWVAQNGAGYFCNENARHWCKSTCGTCS